MKMDIMKDVYKRQLLNMLASLLNGRTGFFIFLATLIIIIIIYYCLLYTPLPIKMNPYDEKNSEPNFWLSCLIIDKKAMCKQVRSEKEALFISETGKTCPAEILEELAKYNVEGRPIWKPMHMQPLFRMNPFITKE